jgi:hypothetical protein
MIPCLIDDDRLVSVINCHRFLRMEHIDRPCHRRCGRHEPLVNLESELTFLGHRRMDRAQILIRICEC